MSDGGQAMPQTRAISRRRRLEPQLALTTARYRVYASNDSVTDLALRAPDLLIVRT